MDYWQAAVLAFVEGATEFLPISSTAHLMLGSQLLGLGDSGYLKSFEIAIQSGAILAIVSLYFKKLWLRWDNVARIGVAFLPTGIVGMLAYKAVKEVLLGTPWIAILTMGAGGLLIWKWESKKQSDAGMKSWEELSWIKCVGVGLLQSLSIIPGVSRAAAAIFGGIGLGLSRKAAVELSFLLAVPTILAATGYDILKNSTQWSMEEVKLMGWGVMISWLVGIAVVKWLIGFVQNRNMKIFGIYRMVLAVCWGIWMLAV